MNTAPKIPNPPEGFEIVAVCQVQRMPMEAFIAIVKAFADAYPDSKLMNHEIPNRMVIIAPKKTATEGQ